MAQKDIAYEGDVVVIRCSTHQHVNTTQTRVYILPQSKHQSPPHSAVIFKRNSYVKYMVEQIAYYELHEDLSSQIRLLTLESVRTASGS